VDHVAGDDRLLAVGLDDHADVAGPCGCPVIERHDPDHEATDSVDRTPARHRADGAVNLDVTLMLEPRHPLQYANGSLASE